MKGLMPQDSVFVTILRNPVQHFESLYGYYHLRSYYGVPVSELVDIDQEKWNVKPWKRAHGKFGFNQMLFDLGFDAVNKSVHQVDEYIGRLDTQFDLVMISDRMSESLILLKSLLNWDYSDVSVFKVCITHKLICAKFLILQVNARKKTNDKLNEEAKKAIQSLNWADVRLYRHFLNKFENQIQRFSLEKMVQEKNHMQKVVLEWEKRCFDTIEEIDEERQENCKLMTENELEFTDLLRKRQANVLL